MKTKYVKIVYDDHELEIPKHLLPAKHNWLLLKLMIVPVTIAMLAISLAYCTPSTF